MYLYKKILLFCRSKLGCISKNLIHGSCIYRTEINVILINAIYKYIVSS
jgi:hypothetical protein